MTKVLLMRPYATPMGVFPKSVDGIPTDVPERVIKAYGLPKKAKRVDENYRPTHRDPLDDIPETEEEVKARLREELLAEMAAENKAKEEAENAKLDAEEDEAEEDEAEEDEAEEDDLAGLLEGSVKDVVEAFGGLSGEELEELLALEKEGKNRVSLTVEIEAKLEELAG